MPFVVIFPPDVSVPVESADDSVLVESNDCSVDEGSMDVFVILVLVSDGLVRIGVVVE